MKEEKEKGLRNTALALDLNSFVAGHAFRVALYSFAFAFGLVGLTGFTARLANQGITPDMEILRVSFFAGLVFGPIGGIVSLTRRITAFEKFKEMQHEYARLALEAQRPQPAIIANGGNNGDRRSVYIDTGESHSIMIRSIGEHLPAVQRWAMALTDGQASFSRDSAKSFSVPPRIFYQVQTFYEKQGWAYKVDPSVQNSPWELTETGEARMGAMAYASASPTEAGASD